MNANDRTYIRISSSDKELIKQAAEKQRLKPATFMRKILAEYAEKILKDGADYATK